MKSSENLFKSSLEKSYINDPSVVKNIDIMSDLQKYSDEMTETDDKIPGGMSKNKSLKDIAGKHSKGSKVEEMLSHLKKQIVKGTKVEMEHTSDPTVAFEIAKDHLFEDPDYYIKLKKIETKEVTGSGSSGAFSAPLFGGEIDDENKKIEATEATSSASVGAYSTPAFVAKNDKNWRGGKKPIYKGGKFAQVKKKCLTFPYCNQGAGAVAYKNKSSLDEAIKGASQRLGMEEQMIRRILYNHFKNKKK
jgi:hypothetical protein